MKKLLIGSFAFWDFQMEPLHFQEKPVIFLFMSLFEIHIVLSWRFTFALPWNMMTFFMRKKNIKNVVGFYGTNQTVSQISSYGQSRNQPKIQAQDSSNSNPVIIHSRYFWMSLINHSGSKKVHYHQIYFILKREKSLLKPFAFISANITLSLIKASICFLSRTRTLLV